jgi:hypothetical protein
VTVAKNSTDTRLAENPVIVSFWKLLTVTEGHTFKVQPIQRNSGKAIATY